MGQQQLLLIVLVSIIIGISSIIGLVLFENFRDESYKDIIRQEVLEAASFGQLYFTTPTPLGGGNKSYANITMADIQLDTASVISRFTISERDVSFFKITASPKSDLEDLTLVVYSNSVEWE
tara:strand:- start:6775 stop:7140 length:366 start_codon:yes stop_codon:yes gene_type:complete